MTQQFGFPSEERRVPTALLRDPPTRSRIRRNGAREVEIAHFLLAKNLENSGMVAARFNTQAILKDRDGDHHALVPVCRSKGDPKKVTAPSRYDIYKDNSLDVDFPNLDK